jgi:hypothetical protein
MEAGARAIFVPPKLQVSPRELARRERVKLERGPQPGPDLFEVLDLEHRRRRTVHLEHLDGGLEDVLPGDTDLLSLEAPEERDAVVPTRVVLPARLLALPLEDEPRIAEGGGLQEVVSRCEGEQKREVLRKVQGPVWQAGAEGRRQERRVPQRGQESYLATIMGSSSWRVSFAESLLFTKAPSVRKGGRPDRSDSARFTRCRTRKSRSIFVCEASCGSEDSNGLTDRLLDNGSSRAEYSNQSRSD